MDRELKFKGKSVKPQREIPNIFRFSPQDAQWRMLDADSQMTTGFFTLRPGTGWEMNHSQMTTGLFMLQNCMLDSSTLAKATARQAMLDAR